MHTMKSILKHKTLKKNPLVGVETQNNTIGIVRWNLPEESVQGHNTAPCSVSFENSAAHSTRSQQKQRQPSLKDLRSLQECVQFLNRWKLQVAKVCKKDNSAGEGCSTWADGAVERSEDPRTERSLEESRKLILQWADELNSVDRLCKDSKWMKERFEHSEEDEQQKKDDDDEVLEERLMEWARELQSVSESCGVLGEELGQTLRLLGLRKKRLVTLMPLLEFITWSLLKDDKKDVISQLWLSAKQRSWQAGTPQYIPNSVWSWITSAAVDVTLDPVTNHPWLLLSDDYKKVQEALQESYVPPSSQRFNTWPCVLGWEGYMQGRSYWEVELANNGYWRVGVTTASSKRLGRCPMKPSKGYWTLWRSTRQFYACTDPATPLPLALVPKKVGIYIDYEEGQISFYNAENKSHIFTFTGHFREKLYPLFAPLDGRTLMTISSPSNSSAL